LLNRFMEKTQPEEFLPWSVKWTFELWTRKFLAKCFMHLAHTHWPPRILTFCISDTMDENCNTKTYISSIIWTFLKNSLKRGVNLWCQIWLFWFQRVEFKKYTMINLFLNNNKNPIRVSVVEFSYFKILTCFWRFCDW
jgi:hypothetical protein